MTLDKLNTLSKEELIEQKRSDKTALFAAKKEQIKLTDSLVSQPVIISPETEIKKSSASSEKDTLEVTVVANTTNFMDSHFDVLIPGAYDESIATRGITIPHIADHKREATSHVGDVKKVYVKDIALKELGLDQEGFAQALLFDTTIRKDYNSKIYEFYKAGKINQHSIGLTYGDIQLAINSQHEDDKAEYEVWQKYYPSIVNKELADKKGYFWAVTKVDVRENSAVLFGSNSLTPTLSISKNDPFSKLTKQPISINKGVTMTLEEQLQQAQAEIATLKAQAGSASVTAAKAEQERILGIQKAAETYGIEGDITKYITKGYTVEQVEDMFGMIGEKKQKENPSPKQEQQSGQEGSGKKGDEIPTDPADQLVFGFKHLTSMNDVFKGFK